MPGVGIKENAMATAIRGTRGGLQRARHDQLQRLLTLQDQMLRTRKEALRRGLPPEMTDVTDNEEHSADAEEFEVGASVLELTAQTVRGIETALRRLKDGDYGMCSDCGSKVSVVRLKALPFAALCHGCQERRDSATALVAARRATAGTVFA
jgi:DnaK suppressor protein